ncbi:hypothetical protein ABZX85_39735 [Streptomyces sp. NPDC004539]|uniref:hypothetical protein n=1 Tax=Streptomyces sp. NPDC004539 TaxID=3154280 RepID=UPI00339FA93D
MSMLTRARRIVPVALLAGVSAVALAASPASAAVSQINVSTSAIPSGANCVYITAEPPSGSGRISSALSFNVGGSFQTGSFPVNAGETVRFEWHKNNCGPQSILRTNSYVAPNVTTWNIT